MGSSWEDGRTNETSATTLTSSASAGKTTTRETKEKKTYTMSDLLPGRGFNDDATFDGTTCFDGTTAAEVGLETEENKSGNATPLQQKQNKNKKHDWNMEDFLWSSEHAIGVKRTREEEERSNALRLRDEKEGKERRAVLSQRRSLELKPLIRTADDAERDRERYFARNANELNVSKEGMMRETNSHGETTLTRDNNHHYKKSTVRGGKQSSVYCRVKYCENECLTLYSTRSKVCSFHLKANAVEYGNESCRFCQKCTKFHPLTAFEENRRACKASLTRLSNSRANSQKDAKKATKSCHVASSNAPSVASIDEYNKSNKHKIKIAIPSS